MAGGVSLAGGLNGRQKPNAGHDDRAYHNPMHGHACEVRAVCQPGDHDYKTGGIKSERHAISLANSCAAAQNLAYLESLAQQSA
jgi:hypothetical protein